MVPLPGEEEEKKFYSDEKSNPLEDYHYVWEVFDFFFFSLF